MHDLVKSSIENWFGKLKRYAGNFPAKGTIGGALVVLESLKHQFVLDIDAHTASGGSQIKGASGATVNKILAIFGETRPFIKEGGRTNRGLRGDIKSLLDSLTGLNLEKLSPEDRDAALVCCQRFLVDKVGEFHGKKRLEFEYTSNRSTCQLISDILDKARETGKEGPVAQYLVGAKLSLRFPDMSVSNESSSTADDQSGRQGDFHLGDTVLHITVAPMPPVYEKCRQNIANGLRPILLVPTRRLTGARETIETMLGHAPVMVFDIESFISQNLEERSCFTNKGRTQGLKALLEIYNRRVHAIESDKSLLINIPHALL